MNKIVAVRGTMVLCAAGLLLVAGCTASPPPASDVAEVTASDTCAALGDVGTLVLNVKTADAQGRVVGGEFDGAMRLAARWVHRIPVEPGTDLAAAIDGVIDAAPLQAGVDPLSDEWNAAFAAAGDVCEAETGSFGVEGWNGG